MRTNLKNRNNIRMQFIGKFKCFGTKRNFHGYPETTVLLVNVKNEKGKKLTDHIWFNYTKGFQKLNLSEGCNIEFDVRVKEYLKGYRGYREDVYKDLSIDYKLSHSIKIKMVEK